MYTNAQSIIKKMDELKVVANMVKPDVIALTETWTNDQIDNSFLNVEGYEVVARDDREDTEKGRGGGVLIYVKKTLCAWKVDVGGDFCQCKGIKIKGKKTRYCPLRCISVAQFFGTK